MGRAIAERFPEARAVYDEASRGGRLRRRPGLLRGADREADARPTCSNRRLSRPRLRACAPSTPSASSRTSSSATRSASTPRSLRPHRSPIGMRSRSSSERGRAMAEVADRHPGRDGRGYRPRGHGGRGALRRDRERVAGELQLPGPGRRLRRERRGGPAIEEASAAGSPQDREASRSAAPSTARSSRGLPSILRPALERRELLQSGDAFHVDGDCARGGSAAHRRAARRAADGSGEVDAGRSRAGRPGRDHLRRDRARPGSQPAFCGVATALCGRCPSAIPSRSRSCRRRSLPPATLRLSKGRSPSSPGGRGESARRSHGSSARPGRRWR